MTVKVSFSRFNKYHMDYDYDSTSCDGDCDMICRCSRITNIRVNSVDPTLKMVTLETLYQDARGANRTREYKPSVIESYCIDRLLRIHRAWDHTKWEGFTAGGYYGEELGGFYFDNASKVEHDVDQIINVLKNDVDRIKYVLNAEYSYLLVGVANATSYKIGWTEPAGLLKNDGYFARVKRDEVSSYYFDNDIDFPIGIVYDGRLIDGYHRVAKFAHERSKSFIVLE